MKVLIISVPTTIAKRDATYVHTFSLNKELKKYVDTRLVISGNETKNIVFQDTPLLLFNSKAKKYKNTVLRLINKIYINFYLFYSIFANINVRSFDIICERPEPLNFAGMMISKIVRKPTILEVNGILDEEFFYEDGIKNKIIQKIISKSFELQLRSASAVIVQTEELNRIVHYRFKVKEKCIHIVGNGVEDLKGTPTPTEVGTDFIFLYAGILDKLHDLKDLFEAIVKVEKNYKFYIIGEGTLLEEYRKRYAFDERLVFTGKKSHDGVLSLLAKADLCLIGYGMNPLFIKYGFYFCPLKLLEYAAAGKSTVIYGVGASNSFIKKFEKSGACEVVNTEEEFIKVISELIEDDRRRYEMGGIAKNIARCYTWDKSAKETYGVIKKVYFSFYKPHKNQKILPSDNQLK
jgi:glycosyltransferase involved in cell wall biosynthesis